MKAEFLLENIENFLPLLGKILPIHSQIQILSNLLIEATNTGLYISTTNLEIGIRVMIQAKVSEEGATTVPGRQFIEALSSFPKDKISMSLDKEKLTLSSRNGKVAFQTIAKEEFPTLFEERGDEVYKFEASELQSIFPKLIFAVSTDESRPELTGVLVSENATGTDFVATDGFRLSLETIQGKKIFKEEISMIFPARVINEVLSYKNSGKVTMYIYKKANQIIFEMEDVIIVGRIINGDFPNYKRVIPKSSKTKVVVDREEFLRSLRISSVFAKEAANIVRIVVEEEKLKILSSAASVGEGEEIIDAEIEGDSNEIAFNVKFLTDALKNISGKTVIMELLSGVEPAVFKTEEDVNFTHVIMPVRVQE